MGRLRPEPAASRFVYRNFFKYGNTYMATCMATAVVAGIAYENVMNSIWDWNNQGVRCRPCRLCRLPPFPH